MPAHPHPSVASLFRPAAARPACLPDNPADTRQSASRPSPNPFPSSKRTASATLALRSSHLPAALPSGTSARPSATPRIAGPKACIPAALSAPHNSRTAPVLPGRSHTRHTPSPLVLAAQTKARRSHENTASLPPHFSAATKHTAATRLSPSQTYKLSPTSRSRPPSSTPRKTETEYSSANNPRFSLRSSPAPGDFRRTDTTPPPPTPPPPPRSKSHHRPPRS